MSKCLINWCHLKPWNTYHHMLKLHEQVEGKFIAGGWVFSPHNSDQFFIV